MYLRARFSSNDDACSNIPYFHPVLVIGINRAFGNATQIQSCRAHPSNVSNPWKQFLSNLCLLRSAILRVTEPCRNQRKTGISFLSTAQSRASSTAEGQGCTV